MNHNTWFIPEVEQQWNERKQIPIHMQKLFDCLQYIQFSEAKKIEEALSTGNAFFLQDNDEVVQPRRTNWLEKTYL